VAAYKETLGIYKQLGTENELDAQVTLANLGIVEFRTGDLRQAEDLLRTAYERERSLAGDSAAVASAMGWYSEVLSLTGRADQALPIAKQAVDLATRFAGRSSPVALQCLLFLGDAYLGHGDLKEARAALVGDREAALGQYGPKNLTTLRVQLALANLDFKQGDVAGARIQLTSILPMLRELGIRGEQALAQALAYLGEIDLAGGSPAAALVSLREALPICNRLSASAWYTGVVHERLGEALAVAHQPGAADELHQALSLLNARLGPEHAETVRANTALRALEKATPGP
jgi:tetratricopeptide (TPR) repeat protein